MIESQFGGLDLWEILGLAILLIVAINCFFKYKNANDDLNPKWQGLYWRPATPEESQDFLERYREDHFHPAKPHDDD